MARDPVGEWTKQMARNLLYTKEFRQLREDWGEAAATASVEPKAADGSRGA